MAYSFKNSKGTTYYLHSKEVTLRGSGHKQRIYFFKKDVGGEAQDNLPNGYEVIESKRSGLPVIRRK